MFAIMSCTDLHISWGTCLEKIMHFCYSDWVGLGLGNRMWYIQRLQTFQFPCVPFAALWWGLILILNFFLNYWLFFCGGSILLVPRYFCTTLKFLQCMPNWFLMTKWHHTTGYYLCQSIAESTFIKFRCKCSTWIEIEFSPLDYEETNQAISL